jgi:NAD(P)-dependent dehydrogenase (short-subunit alcohol dehydrogenase family)
MDSGSIADMFGVKGRVALVTGGSSGIGFMIAQVSFLCSQHCQLLTAIGSGQQWS